MVAEDFETVLKGKYPAKSHAKRVAQLLRDKNPDVNGIIYLEGRMTKLLEDNDEAEPFRCVTMPSFSHFHSHSCFDIGSNY